MDKLKRMHTVARHYYHLQGLRALPWGILLLLFGAWEALDAFGVGGIAAGGPPPAFMLVGAGACFALDRVLCRYYQHTFGNARRPLADWIREFAAVGIFLLGWVVAISLDNIVHPPVSMAWLVIAGALVFNWWVTGRLRPHYLTMGIIVLALSFLPLLGPAYDLFPAGSGKNAGYWLVLGIILVVGGLGDHLLLTRSLGDPRETRYADAV